MPSLTLRRLIVLSLVVVVAAFGHSWYRHLRHTGIMRSLLGKSGPVVTEADAKNAEEDLKGAPDDLVTREKLILFYAVQAYTRHPQFEEKREQQVLWLVEHHPECECTASPTARLNPEDSHYAEAKALWTRQVDLHANSVPVLSNAADAFRLEPLMSRDLASRGLAIKPHDPHLLRAVAASYTREMRTADVGEVRQMTAKEALKAWEAYAEAEPDAGKRREQLQDLAVSAFESGDPIKAKRYATELLNSRESVAELGNNEIHTADTLLGQLALRDGNVEEAKSRLLASAPEGGSPALDSYGPRMTLAAELLRSGERSTVIAYLDKCGLFWHSGTDRIRDWKEQIRAGKTPNFGDNLRP